MTLLIGSSVLLITASAIALLFGWITADERLIWTSIVSSAAAAVALAIAYQRSRAEVVAARRTVPPRRTVAPGATPPPTGLATQVSTRPETPSHTRAISKPQGGPTNDAEVVAVPGRKKFHRPDCRHAKAAGTERMPKSAARRRDYDACGICKP
ncbi:MAG: hypothetical protein ACRDJJ_02050 [Actinomycetota bacterium]